MARKKEDWDALRFEAGHQFTPSTPIAVAEFFSGRKKEIGQLFEAIAERGRHAIVYGERGVGKTSLSQVVPLMLPRGVRRVHHIRKAADPSDNFTSIWQKVFRDIRIITESDGRQTATNTLIEQANVIVALPNSLEASDQAAIAYVTAACSDLIVDEAHHVTASTWASIPSCKLRFVGVRI